MKKGFTLIELIVLIAIIGILASVIVPSVNHAADKAKRRNVIAEEVTAPVHVEKPEAVQTPPEPIPPPEPPPSDIVHLSSSKYRDGFGGLNFDTFLNKNTHNIFVVIRDQNGNYLGVIGK